MAERVEINREALAEAIEGPWPRSDVDAALELLVKSGGKFPSGAHKIPADLVSAVQRERLLGGMLRAVAEIGHRDVTVQDVLDRAAVSRPTFYEHFSNKEDCFLAALDVAAERLRERVAGAAERGGADWHDRLRLGLEELLRFTAEEPDVARALIVEARGAGSTAIHHRDQLLEHFAVRIDAKVHELQPEAATGTAITAAGIVGGIEAVLYSRINRGDLDGLESLLPSLMYFAVLPYEGHEAASRELAVATG